MESNTFVGIYLGKDHAVVVGVRLKGHDCRILRSFVASVDPEAEEPVQNLAKQIADGCAEHRLKADEAVVALDCSYYMQHEVHSEFQQVKQIAATVRFDTEEVLATDVSNLGVAFQIESQNERGSHLNVFTAEQDVLAERLLALQSRGIDPIAVVPDICCVARYIKNYAEPDDSGTACLYSVLSRRHGYFVRLEDKQAHPVRAFMISARAQRTDLLGREVFTTLASSGSSSDMTLSVFDVQEQADPELLQERLGMETDWASWFRTSGTGPLAHAEEADPVDYAIAMGAALMKADRGRLVNFRDDYMPFQGKRIRLQSALKWASVSVTILLLAAGAYLQIRVFWAQQNRDRILERVAEQYNIAMKKNMNQSLNPIKSLEGELRRLDKESGGGPASGELLTIPDRLTAVLTAFNAVAAKSDLKIDKLEISDKSITVIGDTSNRTSYLQYTKGITEHGLDIVRQQYKDADGRTKFTIVIKPKKGKVS